MKHNYQMPQFLRGIIGSALIILGLTISSYAQVGFNNPDPDSSALIDMKANDMGLLIPRMDSVAKRIMANKARKPAHSLLIFDLSNNLFFAYDTISSSWTALNPFKATSSTSNITTATTGNVGIGTSTPTAKLEVAGTIKSTGTITAPDYTLNATGNGPVPKGGIIMWSGNPSVIPVGWALCDGTNGTPDLRGRFIVGYDPTDADYNSIKKTGPSYTDADGPSTGSNTQDAKVIRLTSAQSGLPAHNHAINDPGHFHDIYAENSGGIGGSAVAKTGGNGGNVTFITGSKQTGITIQNNTAQNASVGIENRPPYYVLAYIIKL